MSDKEITLQTSQRDYNAAIKKGYQKVHENYLNAKKEKNTYSKLMKLDIIINLLIEIIKNKNYENFKYSKICKDIPYNNSNEVKKLNIIFILTDFEIENYVIDFFVDLVSLCEKEPLIIDFSKTDLTKIGEEIINICYSMSKKDENSIDKNVERLFKHISNYCDVISQIYFDESFTLFFYGKFWFNEIKNNLLSVKKINLIYMFTDLRIENEVKEYFLVRFEKAETFFKCLVAKNLGMQIINSSYLIEKGHMKIIDYYFRLRILCEIYYQIEKESKKMLENLSYMYQINRIIEKLSIFYNIEDKVKSFNIDIAKESQNKTSIEYFTTPELNRETVNEIIKFCYTMATEEMESYEKKILSIKLFMRSCDNIFDICQKNQKMLKERSLIISLNLFASESRYNNYFMILEQDSLNIYKSFAYQLIQECYIMTLTEYDSYENKIGRIYYAMQILLEFNKKTGNKIFMETHIRNESPDDWKKAFFYYLNELRCQKKLFHYFYQLISEHAYSFSSSCKNKMAAMMKNLYLNTARNHLEDSNEIPEIYFYYESLKELLKQSEIGKFSLSNPKNTLENQEKEVDFVVLY